MHVANRSASDVASSRANPWTLVALNLVVLPGLGSVLAGRIVSGVLQMLASIVGFILGVIWLLQLISLYASDDKLPDLSSLPFTTLVSGGVLFALGWFWSLASSLQILRDARRGQ